MKDIGPKQQPEYLHILVTLCYFNSQGIEIYRPVYNVYLLGSVRGEATRIMPGPGGAPLQRLWTDLTTNVGEENESRKD
jgi:hypothetical protein